MHFAEIKLITPWRLGRVWSQLYCKISVQRRAFRIGDLKPLNGRGTSKGG